MRKMRTLYVCVLLIFSSAAFADAQISRGTITGIITDPTGAVIVGARVVATETATGSNYSAVSNKSGEYTLPFLAPGTYRVTVSNAGFKSYVRDEVIVGANERVSVDTKLQLGQQTDTVTVDAGDSLLETVSASNGQTLNNEDIQHIPVDGNTPMVLAQLTAGVVFANNPQFFHPYDNSGPSGMAIGGAASKANELLLDGAPDAQADSTIAYNPPLDAVQQVKVETFQADAAYGHTAGGTVNQVSKSGTNQYHGTLYEYGQWSALDDTPWFTKAAGQKKSVTRFNQYGGSFGAPIVIPKVWNGRNRAFLFFAFEGINDNAPSPTITTTPTNAEKTGDFSALLAGGSSYTIYDPTTGVVSGSKVVRQPISYLGKANVIPPSELNTVGMNLVSYYAPPNLPGLANGENNYYYPGNSTDRFDSEFGRIDVIITSRNKLSYDFRHNDRFHTSGNVFNNVATGSTLISPNWGSMVDDVHVFTAATVWDNRMNWTRLITSRPLNPSVPLTTLGFPASLQAAITKPGFPVTSVPGYVGFGYGGGQYQPFDSWQIFSMVSHVVGKHSFEFGGDLRLLKEGNFSYGNSAGSYSFGLNGGQGWTNGPNNNSAAAPIGQELAALEMGLPTTGSLDLNQNTTTSAEYFAFFAQDNYRVSPKVTLNMGLRYEHDLPSVESSNQAVNGFAFSTVSPINAAAQAAYAAHPVPGITFPTLMGGLVYATPNNRDFYQTKADNFSPRVGVAWTPLPNTAVRGGVGIFNDTTGLHPAIATGYSQTTQMQPTTNSYLSPSATLTNPFPAGLTPPSGNSLGLATYLGQSVSFFPTKLLNDYAIRWDADIQQNLPGNVLLEIGYLGAHLDHLSVSKSLSYVPASYLPVGQVRNNTVVNFLTAAVANPFSGLLPGSSLNTTTVQQQQLLLQYPQYTGVTLSNNPNGSSMYDSMIARLEKRLSHGVRFMANYTWSKKLDKLDYLNPQDTHLEKRISVDDRPHRLVLSGTWQLPFGEGRQFNPQVPVANYLMSGWDLTSIYTYQPDGAPLAWGNIIYLGYNFNKLKVNPHAVNGTFDTTQFDTVAADQPITGDNIRTLPTQVSNARADGINSLDISISKGNKITEKLHAQLRGDFFNALNHPNFAAPSLTPTSTGFAKITSQANLPRQVQVELKLTF
jgi:hypothetical protein